MQPNDLNDNCVMPNFPCGGTAGKFNTYCMVSQQITADCFKSQQGDTQGLSKAHNPDLKMGPLMNTPLDSF